MGRRGRTLPDLAWTTRAPKDAALLPFVIPAPEAPPLPQQPALGAGKINAPGRRIEPGESPEEAAIRETREEVCVVPSAPRRRGHLRFQFTDGYGLECHVLSSDACTGEACETDEAVPIWTPLHAL